MDSPTHFSPTSSNRSSYSCVRCATRKVKCNRENPCSACIRHNAECVFRPPPPPRRRRKRSNIDSGTDQPNRSGKSHREESHDLNSLRSIPEGQKHHSSSRSEKEVSGIISQLPTPDSTGFGPDQSITKTQLLHGHGRTKFVDNGLWTRVAEEFQDPEEAFEDSSSDASDIEAVEDDLGFVIGTPASLNIRQTHPPADHISQLWEVFVENIDPLTKILHAPTLQVAIKKAANDIGSVSRSLESLMFAIYSTAVMSLRNDECRTRFGESRKTLLSRFTTATKAALSRAKFMGTTSIVVLQALVLHLISVRDVYEPRALWTLSGVAVRLGEAMGLHRDGIALGLSPFEAEIRLRLWWQLKMNDFRTAELGGLSKFKGFGQGVLATRIPANVNDNELYPSMPSPPVESTKPTDAIFCILRSQFGYAAAKYGAKFQIRAEGSLSEDISILTNSEETKTFVDGIEEMLETKCLRYCDPSQPLQLMAMIVGRTAVDVGIFMMHHPRRWTSREQTPESEQQFVWDVSMRLLERHEMLQSNPQLQRFAWHAGYFLQWHAFIHVLDTIRANPLMSDAPRAWKCVQSIYENHLSLISNSKRTVHRAVSSLCLKAYDAREIALVNAGLSIPQTPEYITNLREQREVARAKVRARIAKNKSDEVASDNNIPKVNKTVPQPDFGNQHSLLQRSGPNMPPPPMNAGHMSGTFHVDPLWHGTDFEDGLLGTATNSMNIDADSMMAQGYNFGDASDQPINWAQWDAWLGDMDMTHVNLSTSFEDMWQNV